MPPLAGPRPEVVLDAVAGEDLDRAVVHLDREVDGELATRLAQDLAQAGVEVEPFGGQVELPLGDVPRVDGRATCSVVMEMRDLGIGRRTGAAASVWVVSRTTPRGASSVVGRCHRDDDARLMRRGVYP